MNKLNKLILKIQNQINQMIKLQIQKNKQKNNKSKLKNQKKKLKI